jgi:hypothetical protein
LVEIAGVDLVEPAFVFPGTAADINAARGERGEAIAEGVAV